MEHILIFDLPPFCMHTVLVFGALIESAKTVFFILFFAFP
jgi:hypothetical protein